MKIVLFTLMMCLSSLSVAGDLYGGASHSNLDFKVDGVSSLDFTTVGIIVGYELTNQVAIEARYAEGKKSDDIGGTDVEADKVASVFAKVAIPNETTLTPYLLVGYTKATLDIEGFGGESETDSSYGVGVQFELTEALHLDAEYVVLMSDSDYDLNSVGVNLVYHF